MSIKYSNIRANLNTGDLVLFSGKGGMSTAIRWSTLCKWTHVGMIVVLSKYDMVMIWEATSLSRIKNLDENSFREG